MDPAKLARIEQALDRIDARIDVVAKARADSVASAAAARMDADKWVTINNARVLVGEGGEVKSGAGGNLAGRSFSKASSGKGPPPKSGGSSSGGSSSEPKIVPKHPTESMHEYMKRLETGAPPPKDQTFEKVEGLPQRRTNESIREYAERVTGHNAQAAGGSSKWRAKE